MNLQVHEYSIIPMANADDFGFLALLPQGSLSSSVVLAYVILARVLLEHHPEGMC